jgi:hypothetical protein
MGPKPSCILYQRIFIHYFSRRFYHGGVACLYRNIYQPAMKKDIMLKNIKDILEQSRPKQPETHDDSFSGYFKTIFFANPRKQSSPYK